MAHAENQIVINRPADIIYEFVANGLNNSKWRPHVTIIELSSGKTGRFGAVYKQILKGPGGYALDSSYRITAARPSKELRFAVIAGPARPTGNFYFSPSRGGTKVKLVLDYQPKGLAKFMGPITQKSMKVEVKMLNNLKRILETS